MALREGAMHRTVHAPESTDHHPLPDPIRARQLANGIMYGLLSAVSHELRTPLHVIFGTAEMLQDPATGLEQRVALAERIKTVSRDLARFVEQSLNEAEPRAALGLTLVSAPGPSGHRARGGPRATNDLPWQSPTRRVFAMDGVRRPARRHS
jgi:signal transduction histidine kinase